MYAIVDIETTGGFASAHGITEIAVYIHDGIRLVKRFETLVNPLQPVPKYITAITGITNAMVADAPQFDEIADVVYEMLEGKIFIAHNVNFDYSFIRHHLNKAGFDWTAKKICTVRLGRRIFPGFPSYSLGNLCRSLDITIENRHRAGGDAEATARLFDKYLAKGAEFHIGEMLKKTSGEQWLPVNIKKKEIENLPSSPGVYYFHNGKGKVIYVGKAINIRRRVSSHFTHNDPDRKRQYLLRNIHKISFKECASELEAIVFESVEIKRLWPMLNQSQKQPFQKFGLYMFEDGRGYLRLAIDKKKRNLRSLYSFNLLHEGQVLLRKMIEEFHLNDKLCFLNQAPFEDDEIQSIGTPDAYNSKVKSALDALDHQLPTFAVVDKGKSENETLCLLVEKGNFWGMGYLPSALNPLKIDDLKSHLDPFADNDYIRNSIYSFVEAHPEKKVLL